MTERTNGHGMYPWGRLVLFVLFLIFLAIVLKAMGWCVGGVCDVGLDALLKNPVSVEKTTKTEPN